MNHMGEGQGRFPVRVEYLKHKRQFLSFLLIAIKVISSIAICLLF